MPPAAILTAKVEAVLHEVASADKPAALLQEQSEQQASLVAALLHLSALAGQVEGPNSTAGRAWRVAVDKQNLLALLAAALSNSLSVLDAAALRATEMQPRQHQPRAGPAAVSPKQVAVGTVLMLVSTLRDSVAGYAKATSLPAKPPYAVYLPRAAAAAMESCGLISGLAALCERIAAVLHSKGHQQQQQPDRGVQAAGEPPVNTCAETAAASVLQLVYALARAWPGQLSVLLSRGPSSFQPLFCASMRLAVTVLLTHQAAAAKAAAAPHDGSSSSRGDSAAKGRFNIAAVAEVMVVSQAAMRAGTAALKLANQFCSTFSMLHPAERLEVAASAARGDFNLPDAVILAAAASTLHTHALHKQLQGLSPSLPCTDAVAALRSTTNFSRQNHSSSSSNRGSGRGSSQNAGTKEAAVPACQQRQQQQAWPPQLKVPPLHEDVLLVLGIPWAADAAAGGSYNHRMFDGSLEDAVYVTSHTLLECLGQCGILWKERWWGDVHTTSTPDASCPLPIPTELYLPMMRLLVEVPLLLTGEDFMRLLCLNSCMIQNMQEWREASSDAAMVAAARPSAGPSGPDLLAALRSPNSILRPYLTLLAPTVLAVLDDTAAQAAGLPTDDLLFRQRVNLLTFLSYPTVAFMKYAMSADTIGGLYAACAEVADIWSEMPLTVTRALDISLRAVFCRLQVLHAVDLQDKIKEMRHEARARVQQVVDRSGQDRAHGDATWAARRPFHVYEGAEAFIAALHYTLLRSEQFAAALEAFTTQPQPLQSQLYAMMCTCLKCGVVASAVDQDYATYSCMLWGTRLMAAIMLGILQRHHATLGCAASAAAAAAGPYASSSSSSSPAARCHTTPRPHGGKGSRQQVKQPRGKQASSSKKGTSGSASCTGGQPLFLEAGPAPWLGLVGRASEQSGKLLKQLIAVMPAAKLHRIIWDHAVTHQAVFQELPHTLAALQQQLHRLAQQHMQHSRDSSCPAATTDTAPDQQSPGAAAAASKLKLLAAQAGQAVGHLAAYSTAAGSTNSHVHHLSQLAGVLCSLGAEVNGTFPSRAGCNNPGCANLEKMSEPMLVTGRRCSGCKAAAYCSKDCQASHWKQHKATCRQLQHTASSSKAAAAPA